MEKRLSHDLDSIRGAASLFILVGHSFEWFLLPVSGSNPLRVISALSYLTVVVFFVLSGYVISNSLLMNWRSCGSVDGHKYLAARCARILPPYFSALLLSIAVPLMIMLLNMHGADTFRLSGDISLTRESVTFPLKDLIATILLSQGMIPGTSAFPSNGPLWTLSFELWLYLIALLVASSWDRLSRRTGDAYLPLLGLVMVFLLLSTPSNELFQRFSIFWFLGAILRIREEFPDSPLKYLRSALVSLAIVFLCLIAAFPHKVFPLKYTPLGLAATITFIILGLGLFSSTRRWLSPGRITPLRWLARSSFTLYCFHFPLLMLLFSIFHSLFLSWHTPSRVIFLIGINLCIVAFAHFAAFYLEDKEAWLRRATAVRHCLTNIYRRRQEHRRLRAVRGRRAHKQARR